MDVTELMDMLDKNRNVDQSNKAQASKDANDNLLSETEAEQNEVEVNAGPLSNPFTNQSNPFASNPPKESETVEEDHNEAEPELTIVTPEKELKIEETETARATRETIESTIDERLEVHASSPTISSGLSAAQKTSAEELVKEIDAVETEAIKRFQEERTAPPSIIDEIDIDTIAKNDEPVEIATAAAKTELEITDTEEKQELISSSIPYETIVAIESAKRITETNDEEDHPVQTFVDEEYSTHLEEQQTKEKPVASKAANNNSTIVKKVAAFLLIAILITGAWMLIPSKEGEEQIAEESQTTIDELNKIEPAAGKAPALPDVAPPVEEVIERIPPAPKTPVENPIPAANNPTPAVKKQAQIKPTLAPTSPTKKETYDPLLDILSE